MASIGSKEKHKLKAFVNELERHKGRHTELVSVYVPAGYDITKITNHLAQEQGTASNIKSKSTRDNVTASLEKMIQHLKLYKKTPPNGLALFSANVAEREGQQDYQAWSIEPPVPVNIRLYRCDKEFVLEPLQDMLDDKEMYGLVVMDKREATIAFLKGKTIIPVSDATSAVPGKTRAGGQSAHRFEKLRELAAIDFYNKIAEMMRIQFIDKLTSIKGIIVGGPGQTKFSFVEGGYITDQIKRKIIAIKDVTYTDQFGLQELLERSEDVLANEEIMGEKKLMGKFFDLLVKDPDLVSYGKAEVARLLNMGAVEMILLSEVLTDQEIDEFEKAAEPLGTKVELISTETREGVQLKEMGGVAAILRYKANY